MTVYTSISSPLRIAEITVSQMNGLLGLTLCLGKKGPSNRAHVWDRDLETDLAAVVSWRAKSVVTLLEVHEFELLGVGSLGAAIQRQGIDWYHLSVLDGGTPDDRAVEKWAAVSPHLVKQLKRGENILIHCRGGLGRTGTIGSMLLIDAGVDAASAIDMVRKARPGAIETVEQETFVFEYARKKNINKSSGQRTFLS